MWKKLKEEYIINNKWLKIRKDTIELPSGGIIDDFYIVEKKDVALIIAINKKGEILLKKEYRYPISQTLIELPGGTINDREESMNTAKRELLEETGFESTDWEELISIYDYPTKDVHQITIYIAKNVIKTAEQILDESEEIEWGFYPIFVVIKMIQNKEIIVSGSIAALLYYISFRLSKPKI